MHSPVCIPGLMPSPIKYHLKWIGNATEQEKEDIFLLHKYSQHKHHLTQVLPCHFFFILMCFLYVSGDRKLISCLKRFQSSKHCSFISQDQTNSKFDLWFQDLILSPKSYPDFKQPHFSVLSRSSNNLLPPLLLWHFNQLVSLRFEKTLC